VKPSSIVKAAALCAAGIFALGSGAATWLLLTQPVGFQSRIRPLEFGPAPGAGETLGPEEAAADAARLAGIVEDCHPAFLDGYPAGYGEAKRAFLRDAPTAGTVGGFRTIAQRFLAALDDGHTGLRAPDGQKALDLEWTWDGRAFRIVSGDGLPPDAEVISIDGKDPAWLIAAADSLVPRENESGTLLAHDEKTRTSGVLAAAGFPRDGTVRLRLATSPGAIERDVPFVSPEPAGNVPVASAEGRMAGDSFLLTLRICRLDEALERTIADLKTALAGGIRRVIVDVRGNPGGNSLACTRILGALGMKAGSYGAVTRFSPLAAEQRGYLRTTGSVSHAPSNKARGNPGVDLYVITDEKTYSSAAMLAVWVHDGALGKLVGRPSGNSPSSFGDVLYFGLPHSRLTGTVSHRKWARPDASRDGEKILPMDVPVPRGTDELAYLLGG